MVVLDGRVVGFYILNDVSKCGHICNISYAVNKGMANKGIETILERIP